VGIDEKRGAAAILLTRCKLVRFAALLAVVTWLAGCAVATTKPVPVPQPAPATEQHPDVTVALLGATGMVGGYILDQALSQGYTIRALARTPEKLDRFKHRITIVEGDARDAAVLRRLLQGSNVVISALGPVRADGDAAASVSTVVSGHLARIMPELGLSRYIVVSGGAVNMPGDNRNLLGWSIRKLALLAYYRTVLDKEAEYALLAASELDWTLVRCPLIAAEPYRRAPLASLASPPAFHLRAGELASFVLEQVHSSDFIRQGPFLGSR
jgi:putative NADH-flavin reductase